MGKHHRSNRRSISLRGTTYARLQSWCDENNRSISDVLEEWIKAHLDAEGVPMVTREQSIAERARRAAARPPKPAPKIHGGGVHSF